MLDFSIHIEIKAPAERLWAVMRDIERWPEWTPTVTKIQRIGDGALAVGSRAMIWQPKLPPARWEVIEPKEDERTFTWMTRSPGVRLTLRDNG